MCLANLAAMSQVCKGIEDYFSWLVESMDLNVDLTSNGGSSSPGERTPSAPQAHPGTIREQLIDDLALDSSVLMDTLTRARDAMEMVNNGLFSSMEYNAATMVASKHHARRVVLNHSTQSKDADLKDQVENSKYNDPGAFGEMPFSAHCLFLYLKKQQGDIHLKAGPVRQEIFSGPAPGKGKKKTSQNRPSFNTNSSYPSGNFRRPGNNSLRGKGRGGNWGKGASKPGSSNQQKRGPQQNSQNSGPKNTKGKKGKTNK